MERIKSLSEERIIIEAKINGEAACFLVDTGASVGMIDYDQHKDYGLKVGRKYSGTIIGAGGRMKNVRHCDTFVELKGKTIPQFLFADISSVVESIERETGVKILGIIALPQMKWAGINIDTNSGEIWLED